MNRPRFLDERRRFYEEAERMYNPQFGTGQQMNPSLPAHQGFMSRRLRNRRNQNLGYQNQRYAYRFNQETGNPIDTNLEDFGRHNNYSNLGNQRIARGFDYNLEGPNYEPDFVYVEYWAEPGPFQGMGPSNYSRSDERIKDEIHHRLTRHGHLDAHDINVDVHQGVVTLTGSIPSRQQKRMAEDTIQSIHGVQDVENQLHIEHGQQSGQPTKRQLSSQSATQTNAKSQATATQKKSTATGQATRQQKSQTGQAGTSQGSQIKSQIKTGMQVVGSNGNPIGTVKEVHNQDFLVDRPLAFDIHIPFSAARIENNQIRLNIPEDQLDNQGWKTSSLV